MHWDWPALVATPKPVIERILKEWIPRPAPPPEPAPEFEEDDL